MAELSFQIDGMHCGACVKRVTSALSNVPGTEVEEVRVGAARVRTGNEPASPDAYLAAIRKAGFEAHVSE